MIRSISDGYPTYDQWVKSLSQRQWEDHIAGRLDPPQFSKPRVSFSWALVVVALIIWGLIVFIGLFWTGRIAATYLIS